MTPARRALDALLRLHPNFDLLSVEWQVDPADGRSAARWAGPWVLVSLGKPSEHVEVEPAWSVHKFAIWRATGDVYVVRSDGTVGDDPIFQGERSVGSD